MSQHIIHSDSDGVLFSHTEHFPIPSRTTPRVTNVPVIFPCDHRCKLDHHQSVLSQIIAAQLQGVRIKSTQSAHGKKQSEKCIISRPCSLLPPLACARILCPFNLYAPYPSVSHVGCKQTKKKSGPISHQEFFAPEKFSYGNTR